MNRGDKIVWMTEWCEKNDCSLALQGSCGFGRECVGIIKDEKYPDYLYDFNEETYEYQHGHDVWVPEDAYHKHPCVAVLGRGENAEDQLFKWLQWFDKNNYTIEIKEKEKQGMSTIEAVLVGTHDVRMIKKQ